jgi:hypothetical protein
VLQVGERSGPSFVKVPLSELHISKRLSTVSPALLIQCNSTMGISHIPKARVHIVQLLPHPTAEAALHSPDNPPSICTSAQAPT